MLHVNTCEQDLLALQCSTIFIQILLEKILFIFIAVQVLNVTIRGFFGKNYFTVVHVGHVIRVYG